MRRLPLYLLPAILFACSNSPTPPSEDTELTDVDAGEVSEDVDAPDADTDGPDLGDADVDRDPTEDPADDPSDDPADADPADVGDADTDLSDADVDVSPDPTFCQPCATSAECGDGDHLCLALPSGERVCGLACDPEVDDCPADAHCEVLGVDIAQCVPDARFCEDPCAVVDCPDDQRCDPMQAGACVDVLGLCEPCTSSAACGGPDDRCVSFSDGTSACAIDCAAATCPEGYTCTELLADDGLVAQCLPALRTCADRCADHPGCEDGAHCDPLTGACVDDGALCDACVSHVDCGGEADLCVALPGGPCVSDEACPGGHCGADGTCAYPRCGVDCRDDAAACPDGTVCYTVADGAQCLPLRLTCEDRCADVDCPDGQACDDRTGACVSPALTSCEGPCTHHAECGGYDDLCVSLGETPYCALACDDDTRCPLGHTCTAIYGARLCLPQNDGVDCDRCLDVHCPSGEVCSGVSGTCVPEPLDCGSTEVPVCDSGELCNTWLDRCDPVGTPCSAENANVLCDLGILICVAATDTHEGTCEARCVNDGGCPADRPTCVHLEGSPEGVCLATDVLSGATCGRASLADATVGLPCVPGALGCPDTAPLCVEVRPGEGVCAATCDGGCDEGTCVATAAGARCLPDACRCLEASDTALTALSGLLDVTPCDWDRDLTALRRTLRNDEVHDDYRLGVNQALTFSTQSLGDVADDALAHFDAAAGETDVLEAIRGAANLYGTAPAPVDAPALRTGATPLWDALVALTAVFDATVPTSERAAINAVPREAQLAAARVIDAIRVGWTDVERIRSAAVNEATFAIDLPSAMWGGATPRLDVSDPETAALYRDFPWDAVFTLGAQLDAAIAALPLDYTDDLSALSLEVATPYGQVRLGGTGDDHYEDEAPLLLHIDFGGDDTYLGAIGANLGWDQPVGVAIDLGGADTYGYTEVADPRDGRLLPSDLAGRAADGPPRSLSTTFRQGAGALGIGALYDLGEGLDSYTTLRFGQGFGVFGLGLLVDSEGRAELALEAYGQGAGLFGAGVVVMGDAERGVQAQHGAQGFGSVAGVGVFIGGSASDTHTLAQATGELLYSVGLLTETYSYGLGAGVGDPNAEADPARITASGGVGVFVDAGGDDAYLASVGALGYGDWHGLGVFRELGGVDHYDGVARLCGAGERWGAGRFEDLGGDDVYMSESPARESLGYADALGQALASDLAGSDSYEVARQSLGYAASGGFARFDDNAGDDVYAAVEASLGWTTSPTARAATTALFIDRSGSDTYRVRTLEADNGTLWQHTDGGAGIDE